jgi:hypothetical protein
MTDVQIKAISAGFLHAMQTSPELFAQWSAAERSPAQMGPLIQQAMGLASAPTESDLQAMAAYVDANLNDQLQALHAKEPVVPAHCGEIMGVQQQ